MQGLEASDLIDIEAVLRAAQSRHSMSAGGRSCFRDAIKEAIDNSRSAAGGRKTHIVALTASSEDGSATSVEDLKLLVDTADASVHFTFLAVGVSPPHLSILEDICKADSCVLRAVEDSPAAISAAFTRVAENIDFMNERYICNAAADWSDPLEVGTVLCNMDTNVSMRPCFAVEVLDLWQVVAAKDVSCGKCVEWDSKCEALKGAKESDRLHFVSELAIANAAHRAELQAVNETHRGEMKALQNERDVEKENMATSHRHELQALAHEYETEKEDVDSEHRAKLLAVGHDCQLERQDRHSEHQVELQAVQAQLRALRHDFQAKKADMEEQFRIKIETTLVEGKAAGWDAAESEFRELMAGDAAAQAKSLQEALNTCANESAAKRKLENILAKEIHTRFGLEASLDEEQRKAKAAVVRSRISASEEARRSLQAALAAERERTDTAQAATTEQLQEQAETYKVVLQTLEEETKLRDEEIEAAETRADAEAVLRVAADAKAAHEVEARREADEMWRRRFAEQSEQTASSIAQAYDKAQASAEAQSRSNTASELELLAASTNVKMLSLQQQLQIKEDELAHAEELVSCEIIAREEAEKRLGNLLKHNGQTQTLQQELELSLSAQVSAKNELDAAEERVKVEAAGRSAAEIRANEAAAAEEKVRRQMTQASAEAQSRMEDAVQAAEAATRRTVARENLQATLDASASQQADSATVLTATATYAVDIATIPVGSAARTTFEANFKTAVVAAMGDGLTAADVNINSITAGSAVVDFSIHVPVAAAAAATATFGRAVVGNAGNLVVAGAGTPVVAADTATAALVTAMILAGEAAEELQRQTELYRVALESIEDEALLKDAELDAAEERVKVEAAGRSAAEIRANEAEAAKQVAEEIAAEERAMVVAAARLEADTRAGEVADARSAQQVMEVVAQERRDEMWQGKLEDAVQAAEAAMRNALLQGDELDAAKERAMAETEKAAAARSAQQVVEEKLRMQMAEDSAEAIAAQERRNIEWQAALDAAVEEGRAEAIHTACDNFEAAVTEKHDLWKLTNANLREQLAIECRARQDTQQLLDEAQVSHDDAVRSLEEQLHCAEEAALEKMEEEVQYQLDMTELEWESILSKLDKEHSRRVEALQRQASAATTEARVDSGRGSEPSTLVPFVEKHDSQADKGIGNPTTVVLGHASMEADLTVEDRAKRQHLCVLHLPPVHNVSACSSVFVVLAGCRASGTCASRGELYPNADVVLPIDFSHRWILLLQAAALSSQIHEERMSSHPPRRHWPEGMEDGLVK